MKFDKTLEDMVNHPSHYTTGKIEVIDFIEDKELGYHLGNAVKYIARAGKKEDAELSKRQKEIQDLEKSVWYINRRIQNLKNEESAYEADIKEYEENY